MGRRGPRPKHSSTSSLRTSARIGAVGGAKEREKLDAARDRVPGEPGKSFFDTVTSEFDGWSAPELELLVRAAQAVDRIEEARAEIAENGLLIDGAKGGRVRNPACLVEKGALADLRATLKQLRLEEAEW